MSGPSFSKRQKRDALLSKQRTVVFWVEHAFQIYSAEPLFTRYLSQPNVQLIIYTQPIYFSYLKKYESKRFVLKDFASMASPFGKQLTQIIRALFIPKTFSRTFAYVRGLRLNRFYLFLGALFPSFLKWNHKTINKKYHRLIQFCFRWKLLPRFEHAVDLLIVYTKVNYAYVLNQYSKKMVVFMESWDHPAKEPYFLWPRKYFTWNEWLGKQSCQFQGYSQFGLFRTPKFRYIEELNCESSDTLMGYLPPKLRVDIQQLIDGDRVVYAVSNSSSFIGFDEEVAIVGELIAVLAKKGINVYIRPYPLAPSSDSDRFKTMPNVVIGEMPDFNEGIEVFDIIQQAHKVLILRHAKKILNISTTFVFDAALAGVDILQLGIRRESFPQYAKIMDQEHLSEILMKLTEPIIISEKNAYDIVGRINNKTRNDKQDQNLKRFIYPKVGTLLKV